MKKCLTILFIIIVTIGLLTGYVSASSASISASAKTVTVGNTVKITVSFGEKVKMAEFDLNYDKSKFEFVSSTKGAFGDKFSFVDSAAKADTTSVTLTFKAKVKGSDTFKISNLKIATETERIASQPMSNTSVSVTINAKTTSTTSTTTSTTSTTTTSKNNSSTTTNNATTNSTEEQPKEETEEQEEPTTQPAPNRLITLYEQGVTTLEENVYNVMIKALPVAITDDTRLEVTTIKPRNENYPVISEILSDIEGQKTYFDIKLIKDNKSVQPNGYVTVYIPVPERYNKENLELYYVDVENGEYELIKGQLQGDDYSFTTNHFSTYVLVEPETQTTETSTEVMATEVVKNIIDFFTDVKCLYIVIAILLVIVIILLIIKAKRARND